jgi:hypothetical protein
MRVTMTRERLESLNITELKRLTDNYRIDLEGDLDKEALISQIMDFFFELSEEREQGNNLQVLGEGKKYYICRDEEIDSAVSNESTLPDSYNETRIVAMVRSPLWAFAYWEIKRSQLDEINAGFKYRRIVLRVHDIEGNETGNAKARFYFDIPLKESDDHWYIGHVLARSNVIVTPRGAVSTQVDEKWSSKGSNELIRISTQSLGNSSVDSAPIPQRVISDR